MALTRAQYLAPGGSSPVLAGQVQGVKQGAGLTIAADGTISFNAGTATGVVTSISGGTTGLTFSGNAAGLWTMAGVLAVANGGTGSSTSSGGINNLLPSQTGNAGRVLSTNGTNVLWVIDARGTVTSVNASGGSTGLTFSGGPITTSGTLTLGGILGIANGGTGSSTSSGSINNLLPSQTGNAGRFLTTNGSNISWGTVATGVTQIIAGSNVTISPSGGTGVVTINANTQGDITGVTAGNGLTGGGTTGNVTLNVGAGTGITVAADSVGIANTGVTAGSYTNANITVNATGQITSASNGSAGVGTITGVTAGTGLSGGGTSGTVTLNNTGVLSAVAGAGIGVSGATGNVTITNNGVRSIAGSNGISASASTGAVTLDFNISSLPALP